MDILKEPATLELRGKRIEVHPLRIRQLARAAALAEPIMRELAHVEPGGGINFIRLMLHTDEIIGLCSLITGLDAEWLGELDMAEMVALVQLIVEVNADFFTQKLHPAFLAAMNSVMAKATGGREPFNASSAQGIA